MSACSTACGFCGRCTAAWEREDDEEQRDAYAQTLKLNAVSTRLASALYYAAHEMWGGDGQHFQALAPCEKQRWVVRAAEFLKTMEPGHVEILTGLRRADHVIGAIQPRGAQR